MVREKQKFDKIKSDQDLEQEPPQQVSVPDKPCCFKVCAEKFSNDELTEIKENFHKMGYEARTSFIRACIDTSGANRAYSLFAKPVCGNFFMSSLDVSVQTIRTTLDKWKRGETKDKRGAHGQHAILPEHKREAVINHIQSFPAYVSHYKREESSALYLDPSLTIAKMYELFLEKWYENHEKNSEDKSDKPPGKFFYSEMFHALGLKFKPLKSDTCNFCDKMKFEILYASTEVLRAKYQKELDEHQDFGLKLQKEMKLDLKNAEKSDSVRVLVYDLQKVLILPKAPTNMMYYTRNFNMYNLGIHERGNGHFNVWYETDASRGAREIASCLIKHFDNTDMENIEELILWSDSCGGQNRNHIMAIMLLHYLHSRDGGKLKKITLKFLKSGHSFNPCDSDFGVFEKSVERQQIISTPFEYIGLMKSCKTKNPFKVTVMTRNDFINPSNILKNITKRDFDKTSKETVYWLKTHELQLDIERPFSLYLRSNSNDPYYELNYAKLKRKSDTITSLEWHEIACGLLYPDGKKLSVAKKKDLIKIMPYLPPQGANFFKEITGTDTEDFEDDYDGYCAEDFDGIDEVDEH